MIRSALQLPERIPGGAAPFRAPATQHFGPGAVERVADEAGRLGARRALVISDPGVAQAGIAGRVRDLLEGAGVATALYAEVEPEPSVASIERALQVLQELQGAQETSRKGPLDLLVGVGGGSALDSTKGVSLRLANPGPLQQYFGVELVPQTGPPMILIPTTAGTGSEVTPNAIFDDTERRLKAGIVSHRLLASAALVDPDLTLGLPPGVTAASGLDALTHAMESYVAVKATPHTDLYALEATRLIGANLGTRRGQGGPPGGPLRADAGQLLRRDRHHQRRHRALPRHGLPPGERLPRPARDGQRPPPAGGAGVQHVRRPAQVRPPRRRPGRAGGGALPAPGGGGAAAAVRALSREVGLPAGLREVGVPESALEGFVPGALSAARLIDNNPRRPTPEDVLAVYRQSY